MQIIPHFEQYLGCWAYEPDKFRAAFDRVRAMNIAVHLQSSAPAEAKVKAAAGSTTDKAPGGIAIVRLQGSLMKPQSSMGQSTSTVVARRQVREAANDSNVAGILLMIDSPGGTVAGTKDLADDIAAARQKKPVYAYIEDLGASAAYWLASQADKIFANNTTAIVGSIGTFMVVADYSEAAKMDGIKVHVVKAGDFKGTGIPGTEVTDEQLAELQKTVNELNEQFIQGVSTGRGISVKQARELADGRVHTAATAKGLGLIDGVQSLDETLRQLAIQSTKKGKPMSQQQEGGAAAETLKPQVATIADIKAGCPGATDSFIVAQMSANATLAQAQTAWMAEQQKLIAEANAKAVKAEEEKAAADKTAADAAAKKPGVKPLATENGAGSSTAEIGDAVAEFNAAVDKLVAGGMARHQAHLRVCQKQPELREAMVAAYNLEHVDARRPGDKNAA